MKIPHPELPLPDSTKSIFINCPYDDAYEPFFDALIFSVIACNFIPRSAKESTKANVSRIERIFHAIYTSDYSIHDLSRCQGEGDELLARFNMPLELGLAMSRRYPGNGQILHEWLVLVPEGISCNRYVSDLSGYDLQPYRNEVNALIIAVVVWLRDLPGAIRWKSPSLIIERFKVFSERKQALKTEWEGSIPWDELLDLARSSVAEE